MNRPRTEREDRSASFQIQEVTQSVGDLFEGFARYPDQELLYASSGGELDERSRMLAAQLRRRWQEKAGELAAAAERIGSQLDDERVKFDLETPLAQAKRDLLSSSGDLCTRALALHRRMESTFETLAGSVNARAASEFMHTMAEAEARDQEFIARLANEQVQDW